MPQLRYRKGSVCMCVCARVCLVGLGSGTRVLKQVLPVNDARSSSSSQASGPHIPAPRDRGIGWEAELPNDPEGPPSSPWEPLESWIGTDPDGRQSQSRRAGTHLPTPLGSPLGDPAPFHPPSCSYPQEAVIGSSELPQSCFPRRGQQRRQKLGNLLSRSEQVRLRGLGLARSLGSRRPHGPGWLMGAREGGNEGRTWWVWDPIISCRLYLAVCGRGCDGRGRVGGGAGKEGPGWLKEGGTWPGGTRARPLWVESQPVVPHPGRSCCLPLGCAEFPNFPGGLSLGAGIREDQNRGQYHPNTSSAR